MQNIELTAEESEVLREFLQHKVDEADVEMFRTDTHDYKQMLRHRREVLHNLLVKVSCAPAEPAAHG
jgi:hypothetical protein